MTAGRRSITLLLAIVLLAGGISSPVTAKEIDAVIGDRIPLNGTALLTDTVYLFVTGPKLPSNGARMENFNQEVVTGDPSTFTQVPVTNDYWEYFWSTGSIKGTVREGLYTVYAATQPAGRNDLSGVKYGTIDIRLSYAATPTPVPTTPVATTTATARQTVLETVTSAPPAPRQETAAASPTPTKAGSPVAGLCAGLGVGGYLLTRKKR